MSYFVAVPAPERFEAKIDRTGDCWLWTAGRTPAGYAQFHVEGGGSTRQRTYAHRFAYELWVGAIPEGMEVDHLCFVRHCVNPAHLDVVSRAENHRRRRGRPRRNPPLGPTCPHGHDRKLWGVTNSYGYMTCRLCRREHTRKSREKRNKPA